MFMKKLLFLFFLFNITHIYPSDVNTLNFTCMQNVDSDIAAAKAALNKKVADFLAGYVLGIHFARNKFSIELSTMGKLSFIDKKSIFSEKKIDDVLYLVEKGVYKYHGPEFDKMKFKKRYIIRLSESGHDFWKVYKNLIIKAVRSKTRENAKGIVFPRGNLKVVFSEDHGITINETFFVFIFREEE